MMSDDVFVEERIHHLSSQPVVSTECREDCGRLVIITFTDITPDTGGTPLSLSLSHRTPQLSPSQHTHKIISIPQTRQLASCYKESPVLLYNQTDTVILDFYVVYKPPKQTQRKWNWNIESCIKRGKFLSFALCNYKWNEQGGWLWRIVNLLFSCWN